MVVHYKVLWYDFEQKIGKAFHDNFKRQQERRGNVK